MQPNALLIRQNFIVVKSGCYTLWWFAKLCPTSNKYSRSTQGVHFRSHARSANQHVQKARGSRLTSINIYIILFMRAQRHVQKARGSRLMSLNIHLMLFTRATPCPKGRDSWLTSLNIYLMFFTRTSPCTKSKGLPIDVPYRLIFFNHAALTDPDWRIIILFIHINDRRMKSKGYQYIYNHQVFNKNSYFYNLMQLYYSLQTKYYKALGLALPLESASTEKSYTDTKCWAVS
jgi:hypothetical protein